MKLKPLHTLMQVKPFSAWLAINKQYDIYVNHLKIELFKYQEGWEL